MASITGMMSAETLIMRDDRQKKHSASELIVENIIYLRLENKCLTDFRIIECSDDLKFD